MALATHRAGFVHIIGKPNVGKSTLLNGLVSYPLSITSPKPQTTRHTILGIDQGKDYQIMYVDTPGYLTPMYALQERMQRCVNRSLMEGELVLWVVDIRHVEADQAFLHKHCEQTTIPCLLLLNKIDLLKRDALAVYIQKWQECVPSKVRVLPMAAINPEDVCLLTRAIKTYLPIHPPYYPKDALTDKPIRFFAADVLRRVLFLQYSAEIPYSTEVVVDAFEERESVVFIKVILYVERRSQKSIIIGEKGRAIKRMGCQARRDLEVLLSKKVYLTQYVKVLPHWRSQKKTLAKLGYR